MTQEGNESPEGQAAAEGEAAGYEHTIRPVDGPLEVRVMRTKSKDRLPCRLTREELLDNSRRLADNLRRIDSVEDQLTAYKQQAKSEIEKLSAEVRHSTHLISTGQEWREVETEIVLDYVRGVKDICRTDTGEMIVTGEPLSAEEKQMELSIGK
jgi:hypothetical protein